MMSISDAAKEKIKLQATFINGVAIGVVLIGTFTPVIRAAYDLTIRGDALLLMFLLSIVCLALGFVLHYYAGRHLKGLDDDNL